MGDTQNRRACGLCGAQEGSCPPQPGKIIQERLQVEPFRLGFGASYEDHQFISNGVADNNHTRIGLQCGCHNLMLHGDVRGEDFRQPDFQVRYLAVWLKGGRFVGAGFRNWQAKEIVPAVIPVTLAILRAVRPEVADDILTTPEGLSQMITLFITDKVLEEADRQRDRDRVERMVANNRRHLTAYLQSPERVEVLQAIGEREELRTILQTNGLATILAT